MDRMKMDRMEMDCTVSNNLEWKCPTLFTILGIDRLGHFDHSKWSIWSEMGVPNSPYRHTNENIN